MYGRVEWSAKNINNSNSNDHWSTITYDHVYVYMYNVYVGQMCGIEECEKKQQQNQQHRMYANSGRSREKVLYLCVVYVLTIILTIYSVEKAEKSWLRLHYLFLIVYMQFAAVTLT